MFPVQTCWPGDVAPLVYLATRDYPWTPEGSAEPRHLSHAVIGAQQANYALAPLTAVARWIFATGSCNIQANPFRFSIAIGADPATILATVTPVPDTLSEYAFAGLLRESKTEVVKSLTNDLQVPASAEIVLEGVIHPDEMAKEGPYGDHTGYYNEVEKFPVFTVTRITHRKDPIYHSTYTGRPPDEPAMLGVALNEVFVPLLQKQFPEIEDFYLPPEGCFLSHGYSEHEETVPRSCQARDDGCVVFSAPVYVHQVCCGG